MADSTSVPPSEPPPGTSPRGISAGARVATLAVLLVPLLGVAAAFALLWGWGFTWVDFGLLCGMYLLTGLGVTVGFHRLFTHRAFETNALLRFVWGVLGSMAAQGP